jgi:hypothetical protein
VLVDDFVRYSPHQATIREANEFVEKVREVKKWLLAA